MQRPDVVEVVLEQWAAERPDLDVSPVGIFGRLRRSSSLALRELEQFLASHDLTPGAFDILANLRRGGSPFQQTPSELAMSTLLTTGAITGRLDALETRHLIDRVPSPSDRRIMYARLTTSGKDLIDHVFEQHLKREHRILSDLAPDQRENLAAGLAALERALSTDADTADL